MWKAFAELEAIGFIGKKRPRMIAVQASGCAPMVKAFEAGEEHAPRWENAHTIASGIRVPQAIGDFLILRAVRESGGFAIAVADEAISAALDEMAREEGLAAVSGGRGDLRGLQAEPGGRPREAHRSGRAVQLRQRAEISAAKMARKDRTPLISCLDRHRTPIEPFRRTAGFQPHRPLRLSSFANSGLSRENT